MNNRTQRLNSLSRASTDAGTAFLNGRTSSRWEVRARQDLRRRSVLSSSRPGRHHGPEETPRRAAQVLDAEGNDVTPLPLLPVKPNHISRETAGLFLDDLFTPDHSSSSSSFDLESSTSLSRSSFSLSSKDSWMQGSKDSFLTEDIHLSLSTPLIPPKKEVVKKQVSEEIKVADMVLMESETVTLLDISSTVLHEDADGAEDVRMRTKHYVELCKSKVHNAVDQSTQTIVGEPKNKLMQTNENTGLEKSTSATTWDVYDSYCGQEENSGIDPDDHHHPSRMSGRKITERSSSSTTGSSISSLSDMETQRDIKNTTVDPNEVLLSESFQKILLVMEKTIATILHWPELAAFRQLPALEGELQSSLHPEDLDSAVKQVHEEESSSPTIKPLWTFDSELTTGRMITSMTWNKKNLNILAVSYSDCDPSSSRASFICCWSLNNPLWPQRIFSCPSRVASMDFSSSDHGHLAVGMYDGSVAIYNVQIQDRGACVATSSKCPNRHLRPVWQVAWNKQESKFSGLEAEEVLVSMSADGRISMWQRCNNHLECIGTVVCMNHPVVTNGVSDRHANILYTTEHR